MQEAVDDVISRMDAYYLSREDWDTVVELGVDGYKDDLVLKKIASGTKSAFTRRSGQLIVNATCVRLIVIVGRGTGIMRVNTRLRFIRLWIWVRYRRKLVVGLHQISRRPMMYVFAFSTHFCLVRRMLTLGDGTGGR